MRWTTLVAWPLILLPCHHAVALVLEAAGCSAVLYFHRIPSHSFACFAPSRENLDRRSGFGSESTGQFSVHVNRLHAFFFALFASWRESVYRGV